MLQDTYEAYIAFSERVRRKSSTLVEGRWSSVLLSHEVRSCKYTYGKQATAHPIKPRRPSDAMSRIRDAFPAHLGPGGDIMLCPGLSCGCQTVFFGLPKSV